MLGLKTVVLECKDIIQLLDFYSQMLNWPVVYKEDTFVRIQSSDTGMCIGFQYDEDYIPPVWPSQVGKQQMICHLDFGVADKNEMEAATKKLYNWGQKLQMSNMVMANGLLCLIQRVILFVLCSGINISCNV